MTILPVDGTSGVVMESSDFIDPPLSQPEASSSQSRNGWVHVGTLTFNNEGVPSFGIRIQSIDRNNGVGKESDSSNPRHQSQQLEKLSQSRRPEVPSLPIHVHLPTWKKMHTTCTHGKRFFSHTRTWFHVKFHN